MPASAYSPRGSARPTSRRGRSTCSATRPSGSGRRSRGSPGWPPSGTDHPYALLGGELVAESLGWFTRTVATGPYERYGVCRRDRAQPAAADGTRGAEAIGPGAEHLRRRGLPRPDARLHRRHPGAARLSRRPVRGQPPRRRDRRPCGDAGSARRAGRRQRARDRPACSTIRAGGPSSAPACRRCWERSSTSGCPRCLGLRDPARRPFGSRAAVGPARLRDPDAAAVGPRDSAVRDPASGAARGSRAPRAGCRGGCRASATATGS